MASLRVGRYETLRPIASGGMATVYLGRSRGAHGFERQVAIKAMHPHLADEPEFVAMFLDEARMAANIRHPNVVPTLDIAAEDGRIFLVMEYVEGLSLQMMSRALRKRGRRVPLPIALRILLDMLAGLHAAHELRTADGAPMNLVHRDVSPPNVLVGTDGIARIMDFGIARAESRVTSTMGTQIKGKVPYMSPEQIEGRPVDRRSDVYAAGIVTWELLAGERLFRAQEGGSLFELVRGGAKESPAQVNSAVPGPIDEACMRALSLSPDDRYPTAADFAEALEEAAAMARVPIASARALAALVQELPPPPPPRNIEVQPPSSGGTPSGPFGPLSLDPSSVSNDSGLTSDASQLTSGVTAGSVIQPGVPPRPARSGSRAAVIAAIAASLVTGVTVWTLARGRGAPPAPATSAPPQAPSAPTPAAPETSPPSSPTPADASAPRASASAEQRPTRSEPPTTKGSRPPSTRGPAPDRLPPRGTPTTFRPEEP